MKSKHLVSLLVFMPAIALAGSQEAEIRQSLEMWQPKSVKVQGGIVSIVSNERRITDTIYEAMITAGICLVTIPRPKSLKGVSEIRILNQFSRQGYVFEGGSPECNEIINMPGNKAKIYVLGRTHTHSN